MYEESLNTVIMQEAIRYNKLLKVISDSLKDLLKALKGLVVMSEALEKMSRSLFSNLVPVMWASKAYPSLKPLGMYIIQNVYLSKILTTAWRHRSGTRMEFAGRMMIGFGGSGCEFNAGELACS